MASKSQSPRTAARSQTGGGRRRPPPPPVSKPKPWGLIAAVVALALFAGGLLTFAVLNQGSQSEAGRIAEAREQLEADEAMTVIPREEITFNHVEGPVDYDRTPPPGGDHNAVWQACQGNVYTEPIAAEHAVHSLEHGAVWITHTPDLPDDQVAALGSRVLGTDYMLMSPVADQEAPVVLSAWGYQLPVDAADDERIDTFIQSYRVSASREPGATCSSPLNVQGVDGPLSAEQLSGMLGGQQPMPQGQ
jgi:hypothetical protein